ncbi:hypothetical protein [Massilia sp. BJB1822]|uniref:hypothetical protein n=1 Tax=Massilia sp. BJB1822 TaxID=2744470 RepID=UPI0015935F82|nr:hypothetical protein [Massilia sp. BJB1822]NVD99247.1 hypothetical protein [Massilia sp. BJB1822]
MNMSDADANFVEAALEHLRNLEVKASVTAPQEAFTAGRVQLKVKGQVLNYDVELTPRITSAEQLNAIHIRANRPDKALLVTDQLTATQAKHCRDIGLQFVDHAGNAYIDGPGVLIFTSGQRAEKVASKHVRVSVMTAAMVRTVFVLLADPKFVNKPYREIALAAKVSLGGIAQTVDLR